MSEHEIYARNLLSDKGFAPWIPGPVDIAEVGYVLDGGWTQLFNASKERDDRSNRLGVPKGYYPLVVGEVQKRTLSGEAITSEGGTTLEFGTKASSSDSCVRSFPVLCISC